jgi:hypothetical protein
MPDDVYVRGTSENELLSELKGTAQPGSPVFEQQRMGILVRCTEGPEDQSLKVKPAPAANDWPD